jgi:hypothetical protein
MFVSPGGQSEGGAQVRAAGYQWAALDVADGHAWEDWAESRAQFSRAGLRIPIWGRVANMPLDELLNEAIALHVPCILNIEDEFKATPPAVFERQIRAIRAAHPGYTRETVISTVGWLYNDVDYSPMRARPFLLQLFPDDMHISHADLPRVTADCIAHAKLKGLRDVGVTFQTYHDAEPDWYGYWGLRPRSLFSGDAVGAAQAWSQWKVG